MPGVTTLAQMQPAPWRHKPAVIGLISISGDGAVTLGMTSFLSTKNGLV